MKKAVLTIWEITPPEYIEPEPDPEYRWVIEKAWETVIGNHTYLHAGNAKTGALNTATKLGFRISEIKYNNRTNWEFLI